MSPGSLQYFKNLTDRLPGVSTGEATIYGLNEFDLLFNGPPTHGVPPWGRVSAAISYVNYMNEQEREEDARVAAGGRTVCEACGARAVVHRTVCTLGYPGHPGADYTDMGSCEACGEVTL